MRGTFDLFSGVGGFAARVVRNVFCDEKNDGGGKKDLPQIFEHDGNRIRVAYIDGEPWFCGVDVARALEYQNPREAVVTHCKSDGVAKRYGVVKVDRKPNGEQYEQYGFVKYINEGNLYRLIMRSRAKKAEAFSDWVTDTVLPSIRKTGGYNAKQELPDFMQRVLLNAGQVPMSHFSVISELFSIVYAAFESKGHRLADKALDGVRLRPDVSAGRCFSDYLKVNGYDEEGRICYSHKFPDGLEVQAYAYPNRLSGVFRDFIFKKWLPDYAPKYLKSRDPKALDYLPKLLTK